MRHEPTPDRGELALGGHVLSDDGRPDPDLVGILARHLAVALGRIY